MRLVSGLTPNPLSRLGGFNLPISSHDPDPHREYRRVHQRSHEPNPETGEVEAEVECKKNTHRDAEDIICTARARKTKYRVMISACAVGKGGEN